jgi:hypothetical protein
LTIIHLKGSVMKNPAHHWTTFQKGRLKIKACGNCGEMRLPNNESSACSKANMYSSPIMKAGYTQFAGALSNH